MSTAPSQKKGKKLKHSDRSIENDQSPKVTKEKRPSQTDTESNTDRTRHHEKKRRKHVDDEDITEHVSISDAIPKEDTLTADTNPKKKEKRKRDEIAVVSETDSGIPKARVKKKKREEVEKEELLSLEPNGIDPAPSVSPKEASSFLAKHNITIHLPPGIESSVPIISFSQLDIPDKLKNALTGFKEPTPIQACTWSVALKGHDVVGIAETGSGKTLAFGIPALARLATAQESKSKSTVSVLVVAPTRELALQTHETLSNLGKPFGIASVAVFGGVPKEPQIKMLHNVAKHKVGMTTRIIVGTPGRILDLMQEGACDLGGVDYLVLDEADRMLDKGFENDIRKIISSTKQGIERQTMMFSATWPEAVRRLAGSFQRQPIRITVGSEDLTANSRVEQSVQVFDDVRQKDSKLLSTLRSLSLKKKPDDPSESRVLVFALYKKEAARVEQMLGRQGYTACALHGDMSQNARMEMLEKFRTGQVNLMVATDVAARGLDIPNVGAVINYTFPLTIEDYIHRIGRTGRGGKSGKSITFFTGDNHERSLAGEFARVLREAGFDYEGLKRFPMTIKKKEHSVYGAFYRDDIPTPKGPTKIVF